MGKRKPKLNLEKVLNQKNITKYRFAKLLGISTANVTVYFKKDYNPTFNTLMRWSEVLNCKVKDFIEES